VLCFFSFILSYTQLFDTDFNAGSNKNPERVTLKEEKQEMTEDKYLKIQTPRDALAVLSLRFYEKFGKAALPLIEDVCYQLGRAIGSKMREDLTDHSLGNVGQAFVDAARKRGTNGQIIEKSNNVFYFTSEEGFRCRLGLNNKGRDICTAIMGIDHGIFEAATGQAIRMEIVKSVAANDSCCETRYTTIEEPKD
jgi:predicted hydrocarbon binding protein